MRVERTPRVLIVAGSDSGGGAGIQADIRTVTMLGGHPMTAVTALTAQNTLGVLGIMPVPADMVVAQMRSCIDDIGVDAVKIGMLGSAATAWAVAEVLEEIGGSPGAPPHSTISPERRGLSGAIPVVFDPVMVATSGDLLADAETIAAFERLMGIATVVTPNLPELEALGGEPAVLAHGCHLICKGGHGAGDTVVDRLLAPGGQVCELRGERIDTRSTHGTGCTLASALACALGTGLPLEDAFALAVRFVRLALARAPGLGGGHGPMGHQFVTEFGDGTWRP